jgi:hypothetical protein
MTICQFYQRGQCKFGGNYHMRRRPRHAHTSKTDARTSTQGVSVMAAMLLAAEIEAVSMPLVVVVVIATDLQPGPAAEHLEVRTL